MYKDLEIMKTLRYLLIVVAMVGFLSVNAQEANQSWGQKPEIQMKSTSVMMSSGSTLPQAAITGTYTADDSNSPARISSRPRRAADEGDTPPEDPHGPNEDPIGDAMIPLALCAGAYLIWRVVRRRRREDALVNKTK